MFGGGSITPGDPFSSSLGGVGGGDPSSLLFGGSATGSGAFHHSLHPRLQTMDDTEDMPFAVDSSEGLSSGGEGAPSTSADPMASLASSTMMRDMSQPPKRLQLFDSIAAESALAASGAGKEGKAEDLLGSLADQLAEFKTFGASLTLPSYGGGGGAGSSLVATGDVGASSASTPISLRT